MWTSPVVPNPIPCQVCRKALKNNLLSACETDSPQHWWELEMCEFLRQSTGIHVLVALWNVVQVGGASVELLSVVCRSANCT